jgi:hypothetical protein
MKRILQLTLLGVSLFAPFVAGAAATYQDGDLLLIFRESGFNDVEFDLGSVNQFLNQPAGYSASVTGWSLSTVTSVFGSDLTGVSVILAATDARTNVNRYAWISSGSPSISVNDVTPSVWQNNYWSTINSIGTRPIIYNAPITGSGWSYSLDPSGTYSIATYDEIVSANGVNATSISEFGGNAAFAVEGVAPAIAGFWQIQGTNGGPALPATYVGSFTVEANGTLTFTAGSPQPTIVGVKRSGQVSTVTFTTQAAGHYSLAYTNSLGGSIGTWLVVGTSIAGDGANHSLTYTNTVDTANFYAIIHTP